MEDLSQKGVNKLGMRVANAAKWSILTQVASKLINPVTTIVLARMLAPSDFGVVASATMVTSLADMFSDAGFQKYLVQHRFEDDDSLALSANVAFWTNLFISLVVVCGVTVACDSLAMAVGSPGWGNLLAFASLSLPLTSLSSVQTALYQRSFNFRTLFQSRVGTSLLIMLVSVPLAFYGLGPWSMVCGTLVSNLFLAVVLTVKSHWKPSFCYSIVVLRQMLSFGAWIIIEASATWLNTWAGTLIIGHLMDQTHVGYYKTSTNMSAAITGIVTSAVLPVVLAALSEVQNDRERFLRVFLKLQACLALGVLPIGFGVLVYHDLVTGLLLGPQWMKTSLFFGLWTGVNCIVIVVGNMGSSAYQAKGKPKWGVFIQVGYLIPFLPALWISSSIGYQAVTLTMPMVRLTMLLLQFPALWITSRIGPLAIIKNVRWIILSTVIALVPGVIVTSLTNSMGAALVAAIASVSIYITMAMLVRPMRNLVESLLERLGILRYFPTFSKR